MSIFNPLQCLHIMKQLTDGFVMAARIALGELVLALEDPDVEILGEERIEAHQLACRRLIEELEAVGEDVSEWKGRYEALATVGINDDE